MSIQKIILLGFVAVAIIAILFATFRTQEESGAQAEIEKCVLAYDDAVYLRGGFEAAEIAANQILALAEKSDDPNAVEVRGLIRLAYLQIISGKWGGGWAKKIQRCTDLVSQSPTVDRAEYLLYLGKIRGKYQSKFDAGIELTKEALWISNHIEDDRTLALACLNLSELHMFLDQRNLVASNAYRGVTVARTYGQNSVVVRAFRNLISDLLYLDKIAEAAEYAKELVKFDPQNPVGLRVLYQTGESNLFEQVVTERLEKIKIHEKNKPHVTNQEHAKIGKLLLQLSDACLLRNELVKCGEYAELARPHLKRAGDDTSLKECSKNVKVAQLALADNAEEIDRILATLDEGRYFPNEPLAKAYAKVGDFEASNKWMRHALEFQKTNHANEIGFLRQSSEWDWETELKTRKQAAIVKQVEAESRTKVWLLSMTLVLGSTVCGLLGCFYFLLRRKRNSLEDLVKARTESLSEALKNANIADQAKSDFLAQINHEIRNPLTAILGYCDLLSISNEKPSELITGIESASLHLRGLVDKILEVSKIESRGLELKSVEFFPEQTVNDIVGIMAEQAKKQGLKFECIFKGNKECPILSDETKIRQIALNLIGNAIKFTEKGSVMVSFELKEQDISNAELMIEVKDSGIGIADNETKTVLDRFAKASNTMARNGSGLGLFITTQLVNCFGGELALQSELDVGTQVKVCLPVKLVRDSRDQVQSTHKHEFDNSMLTSVNRILVVDDQDMIRTTLKLQLNTCGFDCETAQGLEQTIEFVEDWMPDLVLLDLRMPQLSGYEVLEKIRQSKNSRVLVYAMTGDATDQVQRKCLGLGFDGFITKPFKISLIQDILDMQVNAASV